MGGVRATCFLFTSSLVCVYLRNMSYRIEMSTLPFSSLLRDNADVPETSEHHNLDCTGKLLRPANLPQSIDVLNHCFKLKNLTVKVNLNLAFHCLRNVIKMCNATNEAREIIFGGRDLQQTVISISVF